MAVDYQKEGKIAIFTLNRPEALNSIDIVSIQELSKALIDFKDDDELLVGIITGAGDRAFSIGADVETLLPELKKTRGQLCGSPPNIMRGLEVWKPMIAAINGIALGGGLELALACDLRIASEKAILGMPEVTLGIIPGWGGTQRLPRVIPLAKAAELLLTGRPINAQEAYRIGLVNKVVPLSELLVAARQMAEMLCRPAPLAVRAAKQAMLRGMNLSLDDGLELERELNDFLATTEDFDEGRKALSEKRKAIFKAK
jgi:enoyl-CoA hydratase/carnithine racemase